MDQSRGDGTHWTGAASTAWDGLWRLRAGKPARSVLVARPGIGPDTVFDVRIVTGRPHQIRIHLAHAGHPLVGDPLYGLGGVPRAEATALPGDGGYRLHAHRVVLAHPFTGESLQLEAQPPTDLV